MSESMDPNGPFRIAQCPSCLGHIKVRYALDVEVVAASANAPARERVPFRETLDDRVRSMLTMAEGCGILSAYEFVLHRCGNNPPNDPAKHADYLDQQFVEWMKKASPKQAPRTVLDHYMARYPGTHVVFVGANGVLGVTCDRQIRAFLPMSAAGLQKRFNPVAQLSPDHAFMEWTKLRYGYVAGKGCMFEELRNRVRGDVVFPPHKPWVGPR